VQPVQLSLIPDPSPAPPTPVGPLPAEAVAAATALLASVIAKAAVVLAGMEATADE
jgi:hypothetical protein